ncbi:MAG: ABC transporter permease [Deltaproteobacteria bacterium]|nr:ABC transporter permease [Deltaproteobacteria bacterium]
MTSDLAQFRLIGAVALRNLWLDRLRTFIIGGLIAAGAFLAVIGLSLLLDVQASMRASITQSIAGDLQIYAAKAKDKLALFGGGGFMGRADIGSLPDFSPYKDAVLSHPNVAAFVPMGLDMAVLSRGNELDDAIDALRVALKGGDQGIITGRIEQIRFQLEQVKLELAARRLLSADQAELEQQEKDLARALAPDFLAPGTPLTEEQLQFLETKIAPLSGEKLPTYLQYIGTDIAIYRANFPKFRVIEGTVLEPGQRGIMLSRKVREELLKNGVAKLFDKLHKRIVKRGARIAGDEENQRFAVDLSKQYQQILSYLDRANAEDLSAKLSARGISDQSPDLLQRLSRQISAFLTVDDDNFLERYQWFYEHIAPKIKLYEVYPGQTITVRNYTRSGYIKTLPLKVYGIYNFDGLEDSDLAGVLNIMDLVSFRELYGQMTEASRKELEAMRAQVGLKEVQAEDAEAALFGEAGTASGAAVETTMGQALNGLDASQVVLVKPTLADSFDPAEVQSGLALNAAIRLKDPSQQARTEAELGADLEKKGFKLNIVDWQQASGIVGQFVNIVGGTLVFALVVIFLVAFVIINNSIIVGTLNRTREIGTMRAIGAQRSFIVALFLAETGITGMFGAFGGAALAVVAVVAASRKGIPAANDVVTFIFSGPRLYPVVHWQVVTLVPLLITLFATLASVYAARHAAKVQPADATQEKE